MKIAMANVVLPSTEKAGVAMQVHGLANALAARGHDVHVYSQSPRPSDALYGLQHITFPVPIRRGLRSFAQAGALGLTRFAKYDVLHTHGDNYLLFGVGKQLRTFHGAAVDESRYATRSLLKAYYRVVAPLEQLGARISAWNVGVSEATRRSIGRIDQVIPCGVDTRVFGPLAKSREPTILFIGSMEGRKRGRLLVDAFKREIRPALPNAQLHLVTTDSVIGDGIYTHSRIANTDLAALYATSWLFCLPSSYEGFGVPYIEAMASGTAVIATPNAGSLEVLNSGEYGIISRPSTLGASLLELLMTEDVRRSMAERGIERARRYDWSIVAAEYEIAYERVIEQSPSLLRRWKGVR